MSEQSQIETSLETEASPMRREIIIFWAVISIAMVILSACLTGIVLDVSRYLSVGLMIFFIPLAIVTSILHPGGWLGIIGLILAIKHRSYRWLFLSGAGAIITGIVCTLFVIVGLGSVAA